MNSLKSSGIPLLKIKRQEKGVIRDIKKMVARIEGLPNCLNGEILDMGDGVRGIVMGYDDENVLALVLGDENKLRMGKAVTGISEPFTIPVGDEYVGRMVSALCEARDGRGPVACELMLPVFRQAASITDRVPVKEFLRTGTKMIDALVPIAKGQRQLIIGDRLTGKTVIGLDAILNQAGHDVLCIYCSIGKSVSSLEKAVSVLQEKGALAYTIVITSFDSSPAGEQYLVPFCAATLGEYFTARGRDVLVVLDDLTKHAWAYRQLSLLLERPPGREAYPGDIFYVQTQLMERAGCFSPALGGGSMTFLCLAETLESDMTGYIPSNLISMCDGLVFLSGAVYHEGIRPAIDFAQSFSIIGGRTQSDIVRTLAAGLRADHVSYTEVQGASRLQTNMSAGAQRILRRGGAMMDALQQDQYHPAPLGDLALVLHALRNGLLDLRSRNENIAFREGIYAYGLERDAPLMRTIEAGGSYNSGIDNGLRRILDAYFASRPRAAAAAG